MRYISHLRGAIYAFDIDKRFSGCSGISSYRNIIIFWDKDDDARVLDLIDEMEPLDREHLVGIHESKGCVKFFWNLTDAPLTYVDEDGVQVPGGDFWTAEHWVLEDS